MPEIIVCLKQVIDETELRIDRQNNRIAFEGAKTKISDDDKNAIEEAVRLKERSGGSVTAICIGTGEAKKSLKEALAMGCDKARLVVDEAFKESDALATAYILSECIKKIGAFDLILTSTATTDSYSGIVGPALAEYLNLPEVSYVSKMSLNGSKIRAERSLDEGIETLECELPALVSVSREINQPRLPTLIQIMGAGKKEMLEWNAQFLGVDLARVGNRGSKVHVSALNVPKSARKNIVFEGKPEETVEKLVDALIREGVVK